MARRGCLERLVLQTMVEPPTERVYGDSFANVPEIPRRVINRRTAFVVIGGMKSTFWWQE